MFSLLVRHPMALMPKAPVIFLQYLAALAIVEGVHSYDAGYRGVPLKLKWPNDICMPTSVHILPCMSIPTMALSVALALEHPVSSS